MLINERYKKELISKTLDSLDDVKFTLECLKDEDKKLILDKMKRIVNGIK